MRSSASALLALAACNQVFGSREVQEAPASVFDAPIDAPFACPPIGTTPQFAPGVHQQVERDCSYYATVNGVAVADCALDIAATTHQLFEGPEGGDLAPSPGQGTSPGPIRPRTSSGGDLLLIHVGAAIAELGRDGSGWSPTGRNGWTVFESNPTYSTIAQDHVLYFNGTSMLVEYVRDTPQWTILDAHPIAELMTGAPISLAMTADGLRLVIGANRTYYTDRPDLASWFRPAEPIDVPPSEGMFITDDCARIYVSGLGSVFYAQQR